jgi:phage-related baseplate assembly protein
LGRDINPSELTRLIVNAGAKRVDIISPIFTALDEFEIGNNISVNIVFDGFEQ